MTMKVPLGDLERGVTIRTSSVAKNAELIFKSCRVCTGGCRTCTLARPKLVAIAHDGLDHIISQPVNDDVMSGASLELGQDVTFSYGRAAPNGESVGADEDALKWRMRMLLPIFATGDSTGAAKRMFEAFLAKKDAVEVYEDGALNGAIAAHQDFKDFASFTVNHPPAVRLHQALAAADWDIEALTPLTDLGPPAFKKPRVRVPGTEVGPGGDFWNGLKIMIDGVQYVRVYATKYEYHSCKQEYRLELKFVLYDVFGLDDTDLQRFGSDSNLSSPHRIPFTAWWQLQHQFGYAPLITRMVVKDVKFKGSTKE